MLSPSCAFGASVSVGLCSFRPSQQPLVFLFLGEAFGRFAAGGCVVSVSRCRGPPSPQVRWPSRFIGSGVVYSSVCFVALKWGGFVDVLVEFVQRWQKGSCRSCV